MKKILVSMLVMTLLTSSAFAWFGKGDKPNQKEEHTGKAAHHQLNLTPEQKEQMEKNRKTHMAETKKLKGQMHKKHQELVKAIREGKDTTAIQSQMKEINNKLLDYRIKGLLEMKEVLDDEQFAKMCEMRSEPRSPEKNKRMERKNHEDKGNHR